MDSHYILACTNIFFLHLLLQEFFLRLTPLHYFFPLSVLTIPYPCPGMVPEYYLRRECPYTGTVLKFLYRQTNMLHSQWCPCPSAEPGRGLTLLWNKQHSNGRFHSYLVSINKCHFRDLFVLRKPFLPLGHSIYSCNNWKCISCAKSCQCKAFQSTSKLTAAFLPNYNNSIEMNEIVNWWNVTFQTDFCKYSGPSRNTFTGLKHSLHGLLYSQHGISNICSVSPVNIRLFKVCRWRREPLEHWI